MRLNGRVKWFNTSKGIGCIQVDDGEEIAVRASAIFGEGLKALEEGQTVEFEIARGPNGSQAERVVPIGEIFE